MGRRMARFVAIPSARKAVVRWENPEEAVEDAAIIEYKKVVS
jgi:hypothetical protein